MSQSDWPLTEAITSTSSLPSFSSFLSSSINICPNIQSILFHFHLHPINIYLHPQPNLLSFFLSYQQLSQHSTPNMSVVSTRSYHHVPLNTSHHPLPVHTHPSSSSHPYHQEALKSTLHTHSSILTPSPLSIYSTHPPPVITFNKTSFVHSSLS
ncbi:hypothetical protein E2C01_065409 [Portunus trituberculatus]|uniref:Uncharacterized protein n=1 Tax=Portunus trituberculatus TaxID=210409 RepID=A0A5B7HN31_PORTR|nr:hypothetical protein [Portunus trituberculatus]